MRQLSDLPDGTTKTRSVSLEGDLDARVFNFMKEMGHERMSSALRDLIERGLAVSGRGGDVHARAWRESARSAELLVVKRIHEAVTELLKERGAGQAPVRVESVGRAAMNSKPNAPRAIPHSPRRGR